MPSTPTIRAGRTAHSQRMTARLAAPRPWSGTASAGAGDPTARARSRRVRRVCGSVRGVASVAARVIQTQPTRGTTISAAAACARGCAGPSTAPPIDWHRAARRATGHDTTRGELRARRQCTTLVARRADRTASRRSRAPLITSARPPQGSVIWAPGCYRIGPRGRCGGSAR
eukprot:449026-Prymnesium_polylepis.2